MNSTGLAEAGHVCCTWWSIKVPESHGRIKNFMRLLRFSYSRHHPWSVFSPTNKYYCHGTLDSDNKCKWIMLE